MIVSPLGRIHLCAEFGGNVMTAEGSVGAAFKLTIMNNRTPERNFASVTRAIADDSSVSSDQSLLVTFWTRQAWKRASPADPWSSPAFLARTASRRRLRNDRRS